MGCAMCEFDKQANVMEIVHLKSFFKSRIIMLTCINKLQRFCCSSVFDVKVTNFRNSLNKNTGLWLANLVS